jgi:YggT family protein
MIDALDFIIQAIASLFIFVLLLRFWLPWFRVDFRNPVAQAILKITSPLVVPLRRLLPSIGKIDTATVLVAFVVQFLTIVVRLLLYGASASFVPIAVSAFLELCILSANLFVLIIIVAILLGWFAPGNYNPVTAMVTSVADTLLKPFRRLIPPLGGLDLSPIIPIVLLGALTRLLASWQPIPL